MNNLVSPSKFEQNRLFVLNGPTAPRLSPELANEIGLNESIIFLQLEFLIAVSNHEKKGRRWTYQSVTDLEKIFPFWSRATIDRAIRSLKNLGLIEIDNFNLKKYDKTRWFAMNLEEAAKLNSLKVAPCNTRSTQDGAVSTQNDTRSNQTGTTIPETTSETTTKISKQSITSRKGECLPAGSLTLNKKTKSQDGGGVECGEQKREDSRPAGFVRDFSSDELKVIRCEVSRGGGEATAIATLARLESEYPAEYEAALKETLAAVGRARNPIKNPLAFLVSHLRQGKLNERCGEDHEMKAAMLAAKEKILKGAPTSIYDDRFTQGFHSFVENRSDGRYTYSIDRTSEVDYALSSCRRKYGRDQTHNAICYLIAKFPRGEKADHNLPEMLAQILEGGTAELAAWVL